MAILAGLLPSLLAQPVADGLQLFSPNNLPSLSSKCATAFTANLSCALLRTGNSMYQLNRNLSTRFLDTMCTDDCSPSIDKYRQNVIQACSNDTIQIGGKQKSSPAVYRPIVVTGYYFTNYN